MSDEIDQPVSNKSSAAIGPAPRPGSKQTLVIEMLSKQQGTTLNALAKAIGWLAHTTRAALTGLRKRSWSSGSGTRPRTRSTGLRMVQTPWPEPDSRRDRPLVTARRGDVPSGKYRKSRIAESAHGRRDYLAEINYSNYGAPFRVIHPFLVTPSGP
jgi:Protein of unknown function (DUF3489)